MATFNDFAAFMRTLPGYGAQVDYQDEWGSGGKRDATFDDWIADPSRSTAQGNWDGEGGFGGYTYTPNASIAPYVTQVGSMGGDSDWIVSNALNTGGYVGSQMGDVWGSRAAQDDLRGLFMGGGGPASGALFQSGLYDHLDATYGAGTWDKSLQQAIIGQSGFTNADDSAINQYLGEAYAFRDFLSGSQFANDPRVQQTLGWLNDPATITAIQDQGHNRNLAHKAGKKASMMGLLSVIAAPLMVAAGGALAAGSGAAMGSGGGLAAQGGLAGTSALGSGAGGLGLSGATLGAGGGLLAPAGTSFAGLTGGIVGAGGSALGAGALAPLAGMGAGVTAALPASFGLGSGLSLGGQGFQLGNISSLADFAGASGEGLTMGSAPGLASMGGGQGLTAFNAGTGQTVSEAGTFDQGFQQAGFGNPNYQPGILDQARDLYDEYGDVINQGKDMLDMFGGQETLDEQGYVPEDDSGGFSQTDAIFRSAKERKGIPGSGFTTFQVGAPGLYIP